MAYTVFLSSTFSDLADHRRIVQGALRQLGAIDISMENFGARDDRPAEECVRLVREESDIFVGIYAYRYGFVPKGAKISISEMEYRAASEASLPRFIYMVDENQPWPPANVDKGTSMKHLEAFKAALKDRHICKPFTGQDQLATSVVADVGRHIAMQAATKVGPGTDYPGVWTQEIPISSLVEPSMEPNGEWNEQRTAIYNNQRDLFLTHVIRPSSKEGQIFDVSIYLIRHESDDLSDVQLAEFFLGPYWDNAVFPAVAQNGFIGISTSAYGTFLCICRVTFNDGQSTYLERYIDFEAQRTGGASAWRGSRSR